MDEELKIRVGSSEWYERYRKSDHWKKMRRERVKIDDYCCALCGRSDNECGGLELHHLNYANCPYNEDVEKDVAMLCKRCHEAVTELQKQPYDPSELQTGFTNKVNDCISEVTELYKKEITDHISKLLLVSGINVPGRCSITATKILRDAATTKKRNSQGEEELFLNMVIRRMTPNCYNELQKRLKNYRKWKDETGNGLI